MVYIINANTGEVLRMWDAWHADADLQAVNWAEARGYTVLSAHKAITGDITIYVE